LDTIDLILHSLGTKVVIGTNIITTVGVMVTIIIIILDRGVGTIRRTGNFLDIIAAPTQKMKEEVVRKILLKIRTSIILL